MNTTLITAHEENFSDNSKTIGVLLNIDENKNKLDSFTYIYRKEIYVFFETIIEMNEYLLYGDNKIKRAYMSENEFDKLYDNPINGLFREHIKWTI